MKKGKVQFIAGLLVGMAIFSCTGVAGAVVEGLTATPSTQTFFVDGQEVALEAYAINGHNYVQLRDIGRAVDFGVDYDASTNSVQIASGRPYMEEKSSTELLPANDARYVPRAGDVIPCDDGTDYTITDVSRWDASMFAAGPLADLPTPTCDWSLLDQPAMPKAEARHYSLESGEYLFLRNVYETRRMLYTLYNAIGDNPETWQDGKPALRKDGSQLVRIQLAVPEGAEPYSFWPWYSERLVEPFNSCPPGEYFLEAWDVYKDGVFQRTEYSFYVK